MSVVYDTDSLLESTYALDVQPSVGIVSDEMSNSYHCDSRETISSSMLLSFFARPSVNWVGPSAVQNR